MKTYSAPAATNALTSSCAAARSTWSGRRGAPQPAVLRG